MGLTRPKYSQIYDTDWKQSVEIATNADVGNLVAGNTQPITVDGVTVQTNWRVLVKDQSNGAQNGIYFVRNAGTGSNGWWTRSLDAAQSSFVTAGLTVSVVSGTDNGGKEFRLTTPDPITLGVTSLTFINPFATAAPGGANTQVQFNDNNITNATAGFTFNKYSNVLTVSGNVVSSTFYGNLGGGSVLPNIYVTGSLIPTANISYDLGSPTQKFRSAYFSGNTVYIGQESISVDSSGTWGFTSAGATVNLGANAVFNPSSANISGNTSIGQNLTVSGNVTAVYFSGSGQFLTGLPTAYSNVNVAAYTQTQSFTNYSNVNLSAYLGGSVTIGGNLSVNGNLFVNGNVTTINANNFNISDSLIFMADFNPADTLDIGIVSSFTPGGGSYQHTGFVRDASDGVWKLFAGVAAEPTTTVDFTNATYSTIRVGNIYAGGTTANDNRFLQSIDSGLKWTAITSISSGTTSATADATSVLITAEEINSARFYKDIAYVYPNLELSANLLVSGVADVTGNLSAAYFIGDGSQLTGLPEGYSNVQVASYLPEYTGTISASFVNSTGNILATGLRVFGNTTVGNIITTIGSGRFNGPFDESTTSAGVYVGNINLSPRVGFFNGIAAQNWQIDNNFGTFRWYTPGVVRMSLDPTGTLTVGNILPTANNVSNIGSSTSRFNTVHARATQAQYADLAEIYTSDQQYPGGTVVVFGGSAEVTQSHSSHDPRIAGVVSTDPAYLMNSTATGVPVALQGRVPCRVLGPVDRGDVLVSSHIAGVAQRLDPAKWAPGCVIGKALENHPENTIKTIEVVVGRV